MIRNWSFYDPQSGHFSGRRFSSTDESAVFINTPEGFAAIEGEHDHMCSRVDIATGLVIGYQPPAPNANHEWDDASKRWKLNTEAATKADLKRSAGARISHLETNVQPRAQRELLLSIAKRLGIDGGRSQDIDDEIASLRKHVSGESRT